MGAKLTDINISKLQKKVRINDVWKIIPFFDQNLVYFMDEKVLSVKRVISVKSKYCLWIF